MTAMQTESETKRQSQTEQLPKLSKKIILITGDKGGTGKSTFARVYAHFLIEQNIKTIAFDADTRNPQLARYYNDIFPNGVNPLNLDDSEQVNHLLDQFESDASIILIDLPAGVGKHLEFLESSIKLDAIARENGYQLTFATVIDRGMDCVNSLRSLLDTFNNQAAYIIVKNLHFGPADKFKRFDQSKTKTALEAVGAMTISLPELDDAVVDFLDMHSMNFKEATTKGKGSISSRAWVNAFVTNAGDELSKAASLLGLKES